MDATPLSPDERHQRKLQLLTQARSGNMESFSRAVVLKDRNMYFLSDPDGCIPIDKQHALGLYYHDCRYLNGYEIKVCGKCPKALVTSAGEGFRLTMELTNPELDHDGAIIPRDELGMRMHRFLDGDALSLSDDIHIRNFSPDKISFRLTLSFASNFEDIFRVRGMLDAQFGEAAEPRWDGDSLVFSYGGADGVERTTMVRFLTPPADTDGTAASFNVSLDSHAETHVRLLITISEGDDAPETRDNDSHIPRQRIDEKRAAYREWKRGHADVVTDNPLVNEIIERARMDLHILKSHNDDYGFFAAGVPLFVNLFGRDSIVAALQALPFDPGVAAETLRVVARFQGERIDEWRDEQPGKICHSLRVGEFANLGQIPHTPYYGSIDATALFIILLCRYCTWTGDLSLFAELREAVEQGLRWLDDYADSDGDGFIDYDSDTNNGHIINQGWKDSGNAIVNSHGEIATPPIALVEVQAYCYYAKIAVAELYERNGDGDRATVLKREAQEMRQRFNTVFWLEDAETYALALENGGEPVRVLSSNPGHALWCGIADPEKAERTKRTLMSPELYSGWGIRTLGTGEQRYNPVSYHLGSVWPHDNAFIAHGFRRYGFVEEAMTLVQSLFDAAVRFHYYRMPELFCGFSRENYGEPVRYPIACHPQAWGAGSIFSLLETMLGLEPDGFNRTVRIGRPMLPRDVDTLDLKRLRVAGAETDIRFSRTGAATGVEVLRVSGELDVVVDGRSIT